MNKGIKETKSDTKRNKNVSKIATRIVSDNKRSPAQGKDNRSSSMNSLLSYDRVEPQKKIVQKEEKTKLAIGSISSYKSDQPLQNSAELNESVAPIDRRSTRSSDNSNTNKITEETEASSNQKSKLNQRKKMFDELIAREGSIEKLLQVKKSAKTVYDVDGMSNTQIRQSLARVDDKTAKSFSFLADIIKDSGADKPKLTRDSEDQELNPTDIDLQLSSLVRRVELNRTLLERANQRIKELNFLAERNRAISIRDMSYEEESFLKIKESGDTSKEPVSAVDLTAVSHPAVEELQKTMSATIEMLGYVHKMSSGDLASGEIPQELTDYLSTPIIDGTP